MKIPVTEVTARDTAAQALALAPRTLREPVEGDPGAIPKAGRTAHPCRMPQGLSKFVLEGAG